MSENEILDGMERAAESCPDPPDADSADTAILKQLASIRAQYGNISASEAQDIFLARGGGGLLPLLPDLLSRRARAINTTPAEYSREEIAKMSQNPGAFEKELRAVSSSLAASTRTYDLIMQTYQGLLKYCCYVTPKDSGFYPLPLKERYRLANELAKKIDPESLGHEILGLCLLYGKVFFTPQVKVVRGAAKRPSDRSCQRKKVVMGTGSLTLRCQGT